MKKVLDGIFTMLRKIYREQKKQTKMLEAIVDGQEQIKIDFDTKKITVDVLKQAKETKIRRFSSGPQ